jgi:hypothetical protein
MLAPGIGGRELDGQGMVAQGFDDAARLGLFALCQVGGSAAPVLFGAKIQLLLGCQQV